MAKSLVRCPNPQCGRQYRVERQLAARTATCRHCGQKIALDKDTSATASPSEIATNNKQSVEAASPRTIGRFAISSRLGAGAFGAVYRAHDPVLDRDIALKILRRSVQGNVQARARFLREPKAAAQLRHPNIVPVHDAGAEGDQYYIASAFIEGTTLAELIENSCPDFNASAEIVCKLAEAMDYAHGAGVVLFCF